MLLSLVFLLEGTLIYWIIPSEWQQGMSLAPRLTLVLLLIYAMHRSRHIGLAFALFFGLIHDIGYASPMIGAHSLAMAIAVYGTASIGTRIKMTMANSFLLLALALLAYDLIVFSLYRLFQVVVMSYSMMITHHMAPTLLFNLLFAVLVYVPMRKLLEKKSAAREEET